MGGIEWLGFSLSVIGGGVFLGRRRIFCMIDID